ncbi:hypothetical protein B0H10DRAFT_1045371 [Mycena sp. CBHHK59/15]|nr:hypothetical protein B0H10DRAFT_1045371 [Mycena sp. CBHHK59/15]
MRDGRPVGRAAVVSAVAAEAVNEKVVVGWSGSDSDRLVVETDASARDDTVRMNVRSEGTDATVVVVVDTLTLVVIETLTESPELAGALGNTGTLDAEAESEVGGVVMLNDWLAENVIVSLSDCVSEVGALAVALADCVSEVGALAVALADCVSEVGALAVALADCVSDVGAFALALADSVAESVSVSKMEEKMFDRVLMMSVVDADAEVDVGVSEVGADDTAMSVELIVAESLVDESVADADAESVGVADVEALAAALSVALSVVDSEVEVAPGRLIVGIDKELDGEASVEADTDASVEADADASVEADADASVEADADASVDADADASVEADADASVEAEAAALVEVDAELSVDESVADADAEAESLADPPSTSLRTDETKLVRSLAESRRAAYQPMDWTSDGYSPRWRTRAAAA